MYYIWPLFRIKGFYDVYLLLVVTDWFHGVSKAGDIDTEIAFVVVVKHVI